MSVVTSQCQLAAPSQPGAEDTAEVSAMITLTIEAVNTEPLNKQGNQLKYNLRFEALIKYSFGKKPFFGILIH